MSSSQKPLRRQTAVGIRGLKGVRPIVCVTAYDEPFARLADAAMVDLILVGDSLGMACLGYENTLNVTMEAMVHHTQAARKGVTNALLVTDMPFGSYGGNLQSTLDNAADLIRAGAAAVKLEGRFPVEVESLVKVGIPVMGHIGFTPQSVNVLGGAKVQGRDQDSHKSLIECAQELEKAGAFAIVLELMPVNLARDISKSISIPTIGIGAGAECDGQIQVIHDILGLSAGEYRHSKRYLNLGEVIHCGLSEYVNEVKSKQFPTDDHGFN